MAAICQWVQGEPRGIEIYKLEKAIEVVRMAMFFALALSTRTH